MLVTMRRVLHWGVVVSALLLAACGNDSSDAQNSPAAADSVTVPGIATDAATDAAPEKVEVALVKVVEGLDEPTAIANAGDGSDRLFVVQKEGLVRVVKGSALLPAPFLDVRDLQLVECLGVVIRQQLQTVIGFVNDAFACLGDVPDQRFLLCGNADR